ncbi:MAG: alkaline phosphatase D family protein [Bryobacteraceae bacterium]|nr:alkaline phosphatase D family protein [Bryobacteraceae bacterium]
MQRRRFLSSIAAPAFLRAWQPPPGEVVATQAGDVVPGRAMLWARSARPAEMEVRWGTSETNLSRRVKGPALTAATDFTGRLELKGLPAGQHIFYEASLGAGQSLRGRFQTPPDRGPIRFLWSGDTAGQGYGINPDWGGMKIYEAMRRREPHFFLHSGDTIYADGPIPPEIRLPNGALWKNIVTAAKSKVAETLDEFRGNHKYNLLDEHVRRFASEVAQIWQWDDHEFTNNWSPSKDLTADARYKEKDIGVLSARARQAFIEYAPMRITAAGRQRIYRHIPYGPLLDVFVIDLRSYRGPNTFNRQTQQGPETAFLGQPQIRWLQQGLKSSRALWKVIASDMPIGLLVGDGSDAQGRPRFEAFANGDGPPLGRELELAGLLRSIRDNRIRNTVWLTADVHYTAAHFYDPAKAQFNDFLPFWEFVSGPLNAGTFGPGQLDNTFGPQVMFQKAPPAGESNLAPSAGLQFFGEVEIESGGTMNVILRDLAGGAIYSKALQPERA